MPGKLRFGVVSDKSRKEGHGRCFCKSEGYKARRKAKESKRRFDVFIKRTIHEENYVSP